MAKTKQKVVATTDFCCVKENLSYAYPSFDLWSWNLVKCKWTRMSNHGCGFGSRADALLSAQQHTSEMIVGLHAIGVTSWTVPPLT